MSSNPYRVLLKEQYSREADSLYSRDFVIPCIQKHSEPAAVTYALLVVSLGGSKAMKSLVSAMFDLCTDSGLDLSSMQADSMSEIETCLLNIMKRGKLDLLCLELISKLKNSTPSEERLAQIKLRYTCDIWNVA